MVPVPLGAIRRIISVTLLLLGFILTNALAQTPVITQYNTEELGVSARNWDMAQDSLNLIYVANDHGVLIYDGFEWDFITVPGRQARSLRADRNGKIYVGTANSFGHLHRSSDGKVSYVSLSDTLADSHSPTWVYNTQTIGRNVYFITQNFLYSYHPVLGLGVYEHENVILNSTVIGNSLYFMDSENVYRFINRQPIFVRERALTEIEAERTIYNIRPFKSDEFLILTLEGDLYFTQGGLRGNILPWENELFNSDFTPRFHYSFTNSEQFREFYGDRILFMPTRGEGQFILTESGRHLYTFEQTKHLPGATVEAAMFSNENNLWLTSSRGITKATFSLPIRVFNDHSGLNSNTNSIILHNQVIYVGTNNGIFYKEVGGSEFSIVEGTQSQIWKLISHDDYIVAAGGNRGVMLLKDKTLIDRMSWSFSTMIIEPSTILPNTFHVGMFNGYTMIEINNSRIREIESVPNLRAIIRTIAEDNEGNVWLGTPLQGLFRYKVPEDGDFSQVEFAEFDVENGLDIIEHNYVFQGTHSLLFSSRNDLFTFQNSENTFVSIKDGRMLTVREPYPLIKNIGNAIWLLADKKRVLISGEGMTDASGLIRSIPYDFRDVINIREYWYIATSGGVFRVPSWYSAHSTLPDVIFKSISLPAQQRYLSIQNTPSGRMVNVPFHNQEVQIRFALPTFTFEESVTYRYRLTGFSDTWTDWRNIPMATFTNLSSGTYELEVQARDIFNNVTQSASLEFVVPTPFLRSNIAFSIYFALILGLIYGGYSYQTKRLRKRNQHLENLVEQRTQEILKQNEDLIKANKTKSRFLSIAAHDMRNPLGVIQGYSDLIQEQAGENSEIKELANHIESISQKMLNMINELINPDMDDSSELLINKTLFDLKPIVAQVVAHNRILATKKGQQIITELHDVCSFFGDQGRLFEIFDNIISNAVKYSPPDELIFIQLRNITTENEKVFIRFTVSDRGPGIPPKDRLNIFSNTRILDNKTTGGEQSSGLGLGIVKQMVEIHGGSVWVDDNPSHDTGSRFIVELPCASVD